MTREDELSRENKILRTRISRLIDASLRINESLEYDVVLQEVLDAARSLTDARLGIIIIQDDDGSVRNFLASGMTEQEASKLWAVPDGKRLFKYLNGVAERLRVPDLVGHLRSMGFSDIPLPGAVVPVASFLSAPLLHRGERVGNFFLAGKESQAEFTDEDEESLALFASQAALVISNARRYQEETQARKDLETLIDISPVGVVVFDARTGTPISLNQEARRIVEGLRKPNQPLEELLGILSIRREDGREVSMQEFPLTQALNVGETVRAEEIVMMVPDGRKVSTLVNGTPIRSERGEIMSFVVTLQDMTVLEDMERLRAEFLAMVSHELRAPLTSIKGSVTTLLDSSAALHPAEEQQFHRIIDSQTDRMRELISDLLDVARIDSGSLPITPEPTDIILLVEESRNAFLGGRFSQRLQIDIAPNLPLVMGDRRRMLQLFNNLLSNAARHSEESSTIYISVEREKAHVAVSVVDEGRGVAAELLPQLFRKFTRVEGNDQVSKTEGTGLGLAICKGIVEAHGGRIWAESDGPGQGTRFTFTIPAIDEPASDTAARHAAYSSLSLGEVEQQRLRILVIEDNPQDLRYAREILSKAGYIPIVTGNPDDAIHLVKDNQPELVLLDLLLPRIDGIDLMNSILEEEDVPVIFLSAYGRDEVIVKALEMGAVDYIVKPFSPSELIARIRVALRNSMDSAPREPYRLGDLTIDYEKRRVTLSGTLVKLTPTEYKMLEVLSSNAGRVSTYQYLMLRVWGAGGASDLRPMRTIISGIRRKLGDNTEDSRYIFTEHGIGYYMPRSEMPN